MKEFFRKKLVMLKRNPQLIALIFLIISCMVFTFALVPHSSAAIGKYREGYVLGKLNEDPNFYFPSIYKNTGLFVFISTLFSILSVITFLSVYKKGKTNWFMFSLVILMILVMAFCDIVYYKALEYYTSSAYSADAMPKDFDVEAMNNCIAHLISLAITLIAILTKPLYSRLLNKIDTTVVDVYDELMDQKSDEELMLELSDEI